MEMSHLMRALVVALVAGLLTSPVATAVDQSSDLGLQEETYLAKVGLYRDLFPDGSDHDPTQTVVALDVLRPGQAAERMLVPESEGVNPEVSAFVLFEDSPESVFVVWEGSLGSLPMVKLASLTGGVWSEPIDVTESSSSRVGNPQLAVTQDILFLDAVGAGTIEVIRTVLHMVWWEETVEGDRAFYRPLVLLDGALAGSGEIVTLNDFATEDPDATASEPSLDLIRRPVVQGTSDRPTAVASFADRDSRRFTSIRIETLPTELALLADEARAHIAGVASSPSGGLATIADDARAYIIDVGYRLNPRQVDIVADDVRAYILDVGVDLDPDDLSFLASLARRHIEIFGARLARERLEQVVSSSGIWLQRVRTPLGEGFSDRYGGEISHLISMDVGSDLPAPETQDGVTWTFTAASGTGAVVAWETEGGLSYRKSTEDGWGEALSLETSPELLLDEALELLQRRADKL